MTGGALRKEDYDVRPCDIADARALVERLHYAGGASNTATDLHGLWTEGRLVGVAWWLPTTRRAAESVAGENWRRCVALSRLAIHPDVPKNGCSFLLGASERLLRREGRWDVLVTWADQGQGHTGAIYRACNWEYLGVVKGEVRWRAPDGRIMSRKRGKRSYSHSEMIDMGYTPEGPFPKHKFRKVIR